MKSYENNILMATIEELQKIYGNSSSGVESSITASPQQIENAIRKAYGLMSLKDLKALRDAEIEMLSGYSPRSGRFSFLAPKRNGRRR